MWNVHFSLTRAPHQIVPDLDEREMYAIGRLTVTWALLEHMVYWATAGLAEVVKQPVPVDATHDQFKRRIGALRALAKAVITEPAEAERLSKLCGRITNLETSRHRITHGLWEYSVRDPDTLKGRSLRPGREFYEPFDFDKLMKLAERVGAVNFDLRYPGGKDDAYADLFGDGGARVSREFLRRHQDPARKGRRQRPSRPQGSDPTQA